METGIGDACCVARSAVDRKLRNLRALNWARSARITWGQQRAAFALRDSRQGCVRCARRVEHGARRQPQPERQRNRSGSKHRQEPKQHSEDDPHDASLVLSPAIVIRRTACCIRAAGRGGPRAWRSRRRRGTPPRRRARLHGGVEDGRCGREPLHAERFEFVAAGIPGHAIRLSGQARAFGDGGDLIRLDAPARTKMPLAPASLIAAARRSVSSTACSSGTSCFRYISVRALMKRSTPALSALQRVASIFLSAARAAPCRPRVDADGARIDEGGDVFGDAFGSS